MNDFYLVTGTTILTDSIFFAYGGASSGLTGTSAQRQASYAMAETFAAGEIGTPLTPTTFTGTFAWYPDSRLQLPWKRVQSILSVTALHELACGCEPVEIGGCAIIMDADNAVIDLRACGGGAGLVRVAGRRVTLAGCPNRCGLLTWPVSRKAWQRPILGCFRG